jgi:hypothetical protein
LSLLTALPPAPSVLAASLADSDVGKGSPIGLLVVLLLIVAVYFLYRSMNRHLRKVPPEFPAPGDHSPAANHLPESGQPAGHEQPPADEHPPEHPSEPRPDGPDNAAG